MYKNILLPTDGSELSEKAIRSGIRLAKLLGAKVTGVYVSPKIGFYDILELQSEVWRPKEIEKAKQSLTHYEELHRALADKHLSLLKELAEKEGVVCETVFVSGEAPADGILKTAKDKGCDLIFMASHGMGITSAILGSVTSKVLAHSHIPVLVFRT